MRANSFIFCMTAGAALLSAAGASAEEQDLAKQLANPVAALISVPIQANYDENIGANEKGEMWRTNIQPVIPFSISDDWNVISRTIVPIIDQKNIPAPGMDESGIGDVVQSFFFSPKTPTASGLIWGVGPVLYLDTATDNKLGAGKWGAGPTAVVLKQQGPWTFGALVNHIESFDGNDGSDDINAIDISATFLQPFLTYITASQTTFALNTESTYDWEANKWSVPINLNVAQLFKLGNQLFQIGGGIRYWAESPKSGPDDWGFRLQLTLLFPK